MPKIKKAGKKGSGKELLYRAGGTQGELRNWRLLPKSVRKSVKSVARSKLERGLGFDIRGTLGAMKKVGTIAKYKRAAKGGSSSSRPMGLPVGKTGPNARTRNVSKIAAKVSARTGLTGEAARERAQRIRQGRKAPRGRARAR